MVFSIYHYQNKISQEKSEFNKLLELPKPELKVGDNEKYKMKTISDIKVYANAATGQLSRFSYLVF